MGQIVDNLLAFRILNMLVQGFTETKAFELGIIDADGRQLIKIQDFTSSEQKNAYNYLTRLVFNIKKIINKMPGGSSKIQNLIAAMFLIKENFNNKIDVNITPHQFNNILVLVEQGGRFVEEKRIVEQYLNEDGPANVTGSGVSTDKPFTRKKTAKMFMTSKKQEEKQDEEPIKKFNVEQNVFDKFLEGISEFNKWDDLLDLNDLDQLDIYNYIQEHKTEELHLQYGSQIKKIRFNY